MASAEETSTTPHSEVVTGVERDADVVSTDGLSMTAPASPPAAAVITPVLNAVVPPVLAPVVQPLAMTVDAAVEPIVEPFTAPLQQVVVTPLVETADSMVQPVHRSVATLVVEPLVAATAPTPPALAEPASAPPMPSFISEFAEALSVIGPRADHQETSSRLLAGVRRWTGDAPSAATMGHEVVPAAPDHLSLPAPRPTAPLPTNKPGTAATAGSTTTARGVSDQLHPSHGVVLSPRTAGLPSHSAVSTPVRATTAGASKNSGSRPAFTPD